MTQHYHSLASCFKGWDGYQQHLVQGIVDAKTPQHSLRTQVSFQCRETDSPTTGEQVR